MREAYCTCPVALLGTCNDVAGVLFRIERAVVYAHVHISKTEHLCERVNPGKMEWKEMGVKSTF